ncbi:hypothetical protein BDV96DRAFT_642505 [Lophiotrema nucula]|uniref:Uncharacterized protein n=1 Tax=Lophiotrema nucula TaxID=690887 RepID=A0A6A5ZKE2_9PLEO|nr:hypothetical protein BDV96DRAFT_642505 [Lophiotrema nucula]
MLEDDPDDKDYSESFDFGDESFKSFVENVHIGEFETTPFDYLTDVTGPYWHDEAKPQHEEVDHFREQGSVWASGYARTRNGISAPKMNDYITTPRAPSSKKARLDEPEDQSRIVKTLTFACPERQAGDRSCHGVAAKNMSDVRRHLGRSHKRYVKLCRICNGHIVDEETFNNQHGKHYCNNVQPQRRRQTQENTEAQWLDLYRKLFPDAEPRPNPYNEIPSSAHPPVEIADGFTSELPAPPSAAYSPTHLSDPNLVAIPYLFNPSQPKLSSSSADHIEHVSAFSPDMVAPGLGSILQKSQSFIQSVKAELKSLVPSDQQEKAKGLVEANILKELRSAWSGSQGPSDKQPTTKQHDHVPFRLLPPVDQRGRSMSNIDLLQDDPCQQILRESSREQSGGAVWPVMQPHLSSIGRKRRMDENNSQNLPHNIEAVSQPQLPMDLSESTNSPMQRTSTQTNEDIQLDIDLSRVGSVPYSQPFSSLLRSNEAPWSLLNPRRQWRDITASADSGYHLHNFEVGWSRMLPDATSSLEDLMSRSSLEVDVSEAAMADSVATLRPLAHQYQSALSFEECPEPTQSPSDDKFELQIENPWIPFGERDSSSTTQNLYSSNPFPRVSLLDESQHSAPFSSEERVRLPNPTIQPEGSLSIRKPNDDDIPLFHVVEDHGEYDLADRDESTLPKWDTPSSTDSIAYGSMTAASSDSFPMELPPVLSCSAAGNTIPISVRDLRSFDAKEKIKHNPKEKTNANFGLAFQF